MYPLLIYILDTFTKSVGGLRPTSSGEMLRTGIPLTSNTWSPVWTEDRRSRLRTAESNLRESDNEWNGGRKGGGETEKEWEDVGSVFGFNWRLALIELKLYSCSHLRSRHLLCDSDKRTFVLAEVNGHSQASSIACMGSEGHQRHHVGTLGEWRSWPRSWYYTLTETETTAEERKNGDK